MKCGPIWFTSLHITTFYIHITWVHPSLTEEIAKYVLDSVYAFYTIDTIVVEIHFLYPYFFRQTAYPHYLHLGSGLLNVYMNIKQSQYIITVYHAYFLEISYNLNITDESCNQETIWNVDLDNSCSCGRGHAGVC